MWFDLVSLNAFEFFFRKKQSEPIQRCAGQKVIYDDLRVSRIVDNDGEYDIPACIDNSNKTDWITQEPSYQTRIQLTPSRTLDLKNTFILILTAV